MARERGAVQDLADDLVHRIATSAKYHTLDADFLRRIATESAERFRDRNQALKYAKRKLHQAFGAFVTAAPATAVRQFADTCRPAGADVRAAARRAMRAHASAAERIPWLDSMYAQVAAWCGEPASVADLACGLNPLAIPWMRLRPDAEYWYCDIDTALVDALGDLTGVLPVRLTGITCDLTNPPPIRADVALLLKTLTTVEQQAVGAAKSVLRQLSCAHVIVTLPRRSLSGQRGYRDDTTAMIAAATDDTPYRLTAEAAFGNESVYHLSPAERIVVDGAAVATG